MPEVAARPPMGGRQVTNRTLITAMMLVALGLVVPGCGGGGGGGGAAAPSGPSAAVPVDAGDEKKPVKPAPSPSPSPSPAPPPSPSPSPSPAPSPVAGWTPVELVLSDSSSKPSQAGASLTMDSSGRLAAIWNTDADHAQVYGRLVSSAGKANAAPFRIAAATTASPGLRPAATSHSAVGRFTALWTESTAQPRLLYRTFLLDPAATAPGAVISETVLAASDSTRSVRGSAAAMDARGTVLGAWAAAGAPNAVVSRPVASGNESAPGAPSDVAVDADPAAPAVGRDGAAAGNYAVAWLARSATGNAVQARVFRADGTPLSSVVAVTGVSLNVTGPVGLAMDQGSAFVVTWAQAGVVQARPFQWTGSTVAAGSAVPVSSSTRLGGFLPDATMQGPSVALAPTSGTAVVTWAADHPTTGSLDIFARRFRVSGGAAPTLTAVDAAEFVVPGTPAGMQYAPSAAIDASGNFAVSWVDDAGRLVARLLPNSFMP